MAGKFSWDIVQIIRFWCHKDSYKMSLTNLNSDLVLGSCCQPLHPLTRKAENVDAMCIKCTKHICGLQERTRSYFHLTHYANERFTLNK